VVFEKFAEMNNKYDVQHFAKLIDTFDPDVEVQTIQEEINKQVTESRMASFQSLTQTVFDPLFPAPDLFEEKKAETKYEVTKFGFKKYDLDQPDERLLSEPPASIVEYGNKEEVFNFILDKTFQPVPLKQEIIDHLKQLLKIHDHRDILLTLLFSDYGRLNLDFMDQSKIERNNQHAVLPGRVYENVLRIFKITLDCLNTDIISPLATGSSQTQVMVV
jgi:hypothetical protein